MIQFRLRTLFIITAVSALMFWALFAPPQWLGLMAMLVLYALIPAATAAGVIYHRGYWQAFSVGVASWLAVTVVGRVAAYPVSILSSTMLVEGTFGLPFGESMIPSDENEVMTRKLAIAIWLGAALASGSIASGVRWWAIWLQRQSD